MADSNAPKRKIEYLKPPVKVERQGQNIVRHEQDIKVVDTIAIPTNRCQTKITNGLLDTMPLDMRDEFLDCVTNIEFVKRMIAPDRKRACDLERDKKGRIVVDVCSPHILEDMDYFRQPVLHFIEHGCYTRMRPNGNKASEYYRWLKEEERRIWNGMVRPSDGEWITGYMYFLLNYSPIMINVQQEGTNVAIRVPGWSEVWDGIYLRQHVLNQARYGGPYNSWKGGQHMLELAARGKGKSFGMASMMTRNILFGENELSNKRLFTILTAYEKEYFSDKDGTLMKFMPMLDHCAAHTQFPRQRLRDSRTDFIWQMGYKDLDTGITKGTQNIAAAVSSKDNSDKLRGKRGTIFFEEIGNFKGLREIWNTVRHSVEEGDAVFAQLYGIGTSGNKESDFASVKELICSPKAYNIYPIPNVWDKTGQGSRFFGYFYPSYLNRKNCYDHDGNSDVVKALIQILQAQHVMRSEAKDQESIIQLKAEQPIVPADALLRVKFNIFPTSRINERRLYLENHPELIDEIRVGKLFPVEGGKFEFKPTDDIPIRDFPLRNNRYTGALEIFEMPVAGMDGKIPSNRYVVSYDPVDTDDARTTLSLASALVLDLWTDRIVAEDTGREMKADDNYERLRRLAIFYNATILYENNIKGTYSYFAKRNCLHMLEDTPKFLLERGLLKAAKYGNSSKGVSTLHNIRPFADGLIANWLRKTVNVVENGQEVTKDNIDFIRNVALLTELSVYSPLVNVDRIRSLGVLMIAREQRLIDYGGSFDRIMTGERPESKIMQDPLLRKYTKWASSSRYAAHAMRVQGLE